MKTSDELRTAFLKYFEDRGHTIVKSSSLVPQDDPTLLFTNAGMVQFKRTFLGEEKRSYARACTSQKCVRAGGKHNDLENVGYTRRHHTFFEMLGNFSFGDYFKSVAIEAAWDLMTRVYALPGEKLWVSVYQDDDEAYRLWTENSDVPEERIVRLGEKDNFWSMGDTGPCGPCSEILIDQGPEMSCGRPDCRAGCDCDRYLELWNLVFMEFNRNESGEMERLPKPSIDTGMGLERIAAVVQGVESNFETDLFMPIIRKVEELSGETFKRVPDGDVAMKVVADHSRAITFLVGDGVLPSNEGRGYVLRRILRRAMRYGRSLGLTRPFLCDTARTVFQVMASAYPELSESKAYIENIIQVEEERFLGTLESGMKVLDDALSDLRRAGERQIPGELIFKMYDTYGFPVDIIQDVVRDEGLSLDMDGFDDAMAQQRRRSRSAWKGSGDVDTAEAYKRLAAEGVQTDFVGYDTLSTEATVLSLVKVGQPVDRVEEGETVELVVDKTPFYGEAGGQVGDQGTIVGPDFEMTVSDTLKDPNNLIILQGKVLRGSLSKGRTVTARVDCGRRIAVARNHTATHLLHAALRRVVGDHVKQSGSLVSPERLRFDFTHFSALDRETLQTVETQVNQKIFENTPVDTQEMSADEALDAGATALFEEKYGERVRVVTVGDFSKELCGGTHTGRTGDIGLFKIVVETSVAAGVRRIEALTGMGALHNVQEAARALNRVSDMLKVGPESVADRVEKLMADLKGMEKELASLKSKALAGASVEGALSGVREVAGVPVLVQEVSADGHGALRDLADRLKGKLGSGIIVLGSRTSDKVQLVAVVTKDQLEKHHAGDLVKKVAAMVGGGGGGRPDMAQAGGSQPQKLPEALEAVYDIVAGS